jgi:hypothetical protein
MNVCKVKALSFVGLTLAFFSANLAGVTGRSPGHLEDALTRLDLVVGHAQKAEKLAHQGHAVAAAVRPESAWLMLESHPELGGASVVGRAVSGLKDSPTFARAEAAEVARDAALKATEPLTAFAARPRTGSA